MLPAAGAGRRARQACAKAFFVSPFLPMGLRYEFRVTPPRENLVVAIRASDRDGVVLRAGLTAQRRELTDGALLRVGFAVPAIGIKTMAAIHCEAARLWLKGVAYLGRSRTVPGGCSERRSEALIPSRAVAEPARSRLDGQVWSLERPTRQAPVERRTSAVAYAS